MTAESNQDRAAATRTRLNWLLTGAFVLVLLLVAGASLFAPERHTWMFLGCVVTVALLALGSWRVRPRPGREGAFPWAMLPVAVQALVYLAFWVLFAAQLTTYGWPDLTTELIGALIVPAIAAPSLCFMGMLLPLLLRTTVSRAGVLLLAEVLGPILVYLVPNAL